MPDPVRLDYRSALTSRERGERPYTKDADMAGCVDEAVAGGLLEAAKRRAQDVIAARGHPSRFAAGLVSARRRGILEQ
jgi:hypothetical protein